MESPNAVFIDLKAAFDLALRDRIVNALANAGVPTGCLAILVNPLTVDDGIAQHGPVW